MSRDRATDDTKVYVSLEDFEIGSSQKIWYGEAGKPPRKRRWRLGCFLSLVILIVVGYFAFTYVIIPLFATGFGMADTRPVPGDPRRFDPIAALPEVQEYAGEGALLYAIDANYVRRDGTLDLNAEYSPKPYVDFEFYREVPRPADAPPVGAGGSVEDKWYERVTIRAYEPGQWRQVTTIGGGITTRYSYMNQGMERDISSPTASRPGEPPAAPMCSFGQLWDAALERGAPADAVAVIEYDAQGYDFRINGASIALRFNQDCRVTN